MESKIYFTLFVVAMCMLFGGLVVSELYALAVPVFAGLAGWSAGGHLVTWISGDTY